MLRCPKSVFILVVYIVFELTVFHSPPSSSSCPKAQNTPPVQYHKYPFQGPYRRKCMDGGAEGGPGYNYLKRNRQKLGCCRRSPCYRNAWQIVYLWGWRSGRVVFQYQSLLLIYRQCSSLQTPKCSHLLDAWLKLAVKYVQLITFGKYLCLIIYIPGSRSNDLDSTSWHLMSHVTCTNQQQSM